MKSELIAALFVAVLFSQPARADVNVEDAWVRPATQAQKTTAVYMHIHSMKAANLVGAESPVAERADLRRAVVENGITKVRTVPSIELPANKEVLMSPISQHIMLSGLKIDLKPGEKIPVTLTVEQGGKKSSLQVKAEVKAAADASHKHDEKNHKH